MSKEKICVLVPGQNTLVRREWRYAPGMEEIIATQNKTLLKPGDVGKLLGTPEKEREISALNAHRLLTALSLCVQNNLHLSPDFISGHSLGLPLSLIFADGYRYPIAGATEVAEERAIVQEEAQKEFPGEMYAFLWNGKNGFENVETRIKDQKGVYIACYNYENESVAQVVLTVEKGFNISTLFKPTNDPMQLLQKLEIEVGAHSPFVRQAAQEFAEKLLIFARAGGFKYLKNGNEIFSDHRVDGKIVATSSPFGMVKMLAGIDKPVEFQASFLKMYEAGVRTVYEVGSSTLIGMIKNMRLPDIKYFPIKRLSDMNKLIR